MEVARGEQRRQPEEDDRGERRGQERAGAHPAEDDFKPGHDVIGLQDLLGFFDPDFHQLGDDIREHAGCAGIAIE